MSKQTRDKLLSNILYFIAIVVLIQIANCTIWQVVGFFVLYLLVLFAVVFSPILLAFAWSFTKIVWLKNKEPKVGDHWYNIQTKQTLIIKAIDPDGITVIIKEKPSLELILTNLQWSRLKYELLYEGKKK